MVRPLYQHLNGVPEVVVSNGIQPMGISEGPYNGKPNPHAWMSADNALIYVDNIRDALVKYDPENADAYRHNAETYKEKIRHTMTPLKAELAKLPQDKRWLVTSEGRSPIWPAITACRSSICGRSTPTSRALRSRCGKPSTP